MSNAAATLPGAERQEVWHVLSKPRGSFRDVRIWLGTFGIFKSAEEALHAVAKKAESDREWRKRWRNQQFFVARMDWFVEITEEIGLLQRFRNDVGAW